MSVSKASFILYGIIGLFIVIAVAALCRAQQGVEWDPATVLKMTDNSYKNIPFNNYQHPKPANLNEDEPEFVTWWSPGQFAVPMLIQKLTGVKMSTALKILILMCLFISGLGIFKFFSLLLKVKADAQKRSNSLVILGLTLFTLLQPFFWESVFVYTGGGILLLAYCPWFIYWVVKVNKISPIYLILLLLAGFFGFFLKSSFTSIFAGALFYVFLCNSVDMGATLKQQNFKKIVVNALCLGAIMIAYIVVIKVFYLSRNNGISESATGIRLQPRVLLYPVIAPAIGVFWMNYLNKTVYWIMAFFLVLPLYYLLFKNRAISLTYKKVLFAFLSTTICFYILLYFINVDVSYELRHYVILSILLTPAVYLAPGTFKTGRYLMYAVMVIYALTNIYRFSRAVSSIPKPSPSVLYSGLKSSYPADIIEKVHAMDNRPNHRRDIFYFTTAELTAALEVRNNRVLFEDNFLTFHFNNKARSKPILYYGRNQGALYIVYPLQNFKQDSALYLTRFEKYKNFQKIYEAKGYGIFKAD